MNLVSLKGLREWNMLVTEIKQRLEFMNIRTIPKQEQLRHDEGPLILKVRFKIIYNRMFLAIDKLQIDLWIYGINS